MLPYDLYFKQDLEDNVFDAFDFCVNYTTEGKHQSVDIGMNDFLYSKTFFNSIFTEKIFYNLHLSFASG